MTRTESAEGARSAAHRLVATGLVDREFYEALSGRTFPGDLAVARHLMRVGASRGWTCQPLLEPSFLPDELTRAWREGRVLDVVHALTSEESPPDPSPLFHPPTWSKQHREARQHPGGALGHFVCNALESTAVPVAEDYIGAAPDWGTARRKLLHVAEAAAASRKSSEATAPNWARSRHESVAGRTTIVTVATGQVRLATRTIRSLLSHAGVDDDIELIVVDNGLSRPLSSRLEAELLGESRAHVIRLNKRSSPAAAINQGVSESSGEHVVLVRAGLAAEGAWHEPLIEPLTRDGAALGVQGLIVEANGLVASAGWVFLGGHLAPCPFLAGHPVEDARKAAGQSFRAVSSDALAMRRTELVLLGGLDDSISPELAGADLCLRTTGVRSGSFLVAHDAVFALPARVSSSPASGNDHSCATFASRWGGSQGATEEWRFESIGFEVRNSRPQASRPQPYLARKPPDSRSTSLRWSVNVASTPGPIGEFWADTHFADGLVEALTAAGQDAVVLRRGAHDAPSAYLSDVALTVRGLERVTPQPCAINVLWVISHPELVTPEELREFDLVFAASWPWASRMSRRFETRVEVLHQATNPRLFNPRLCLDDRDRHGAVFIGNGRQDGPRRKIVADAVAAGLDLSVYGKNWSGLLPPEVLKGDYIPNHLVGERYAAASVVLNDHWPDMAANGFINNRVFDAVATGARVVSDPVDGLEGLFGGSVQTYNSVEELAWLCSEAGAAAFPDQEERTRIADEIRRHHSFDRRVDTLLDAVTRRLEQ